MNICVHKDTSAKTNDSKRVLLASLLAAGMLFAGCASEGESHLVTAPPPAPPTAPAAMATAPQPVVVTQPQQYVATTVVPSTVNSYIVAQVPPAPQPEAVPPRPSSDHVWITGYWTWQNNRYAWMAGHWELPPSSSSTWVNPHWEPEGGAYRFYEGHWN